MNQAQGAVVLWLLRSVDLLFVSRKLGVTADALSEWRETFLEGESSAIHFPRAQACWSEHHGLAEHPMGSIQRILGHENRTTPEIYLLSIGQSEREAMMAFERARIESDTKSHTSVAADSVVPLQ